MILSIMITAGRDVKRKSRRGISRPEATPANLIPRAGPGRKMAATIRRTSTVAAVTRRR